MGPMVTQDFAVTALTSTIINFVGSILQDVYRAELPGLATPLHWNCT